MRDTQLAMLTRWKGRRQSTNQRSWFEKENAIEFKQARESALVSSTRPCKECSDLLPRSTYVCVYVCNNVYHYCQELRRVSDFTQFTIQAHKPVCHSFMNTGSRHTSWGESMHFIHKTQQRESAYKNVCQSASSPSLMGQQRWLQMDVCTFSHSLH